jgi:hypothetical protein
MLGVAEGKIEQKVGYGKEKILWLLANMGRPAAGYINKYII